MDEIYGADSGTGDLPFHLPGQLPTVIASQEEEQEEDDANEEIKLAAKVVPIETDEEDIQEWIKQRKLNWMKRISNKRPAEELRIQQDNKRRNTRNSQRRTQRQQRQPTQRRQPQQPPTPQKRSKLSLNNKIIQRELENSENKKILQFVKDLFDRKVI